MRQYSGILIGHDMNERIKQLAEQATLAVTKPDGHYIVQAWQAKFAELIVGECANAIVNDSRLNDVRSAANGCVRTIKEHFGVEE